MKVLELLNDSILNNDINTALEIIIENDSRYRNNIDYLNMKALCCIKIKEYELAKQEIANVLEKDSENEYAHYNLGYIYEQEGDTVEAAVEYAYCKKYTTDNNLKQEINEIFEMTIKLKNIIDTIECEKKEKFIILSSCPWGSVLQRMHHISRALCRLGQIVNYVSPLTIINEKVGNGEFSADEMTLLKSTLLKSTIETTRDVEGVEVYSTLGTEDGINNYSEVCQYIIDKYNGEKVHFIAYMPHQIQIIKKLKGNFDVIYECVDDHSDLDYAFWGNKEDELLEKELIEYSKGITTTSLALYLKYACIQNLNNVYLSRNAFNYRDFSLDIEDPVPEDLKRIPEPRIIYTGAIFEWFDKELFERVVELNPDKSFVILGFGKEELLDIKRSNVFFLGAKEHKELKRYLRNSQVGIIPFKDDIDIIVNCDPIKHYEYIASNLPVVTTFMPECIIDKPNTYWGKDAVEFTEKINKCLEYNNWKCEKEFIINNSWYERAMILYNLATDNNKNMSKEETVKAIQEKLYATLKQQNNSILMALYSKSINNLDYNLSLKYAKQAYEMNPIKYIERNYIGISREYEEIKQVIVASPYISEEIKKEVEYRYNIRDFNFFDIIKKIIDKSYIEVFKKIKAIKNYETDLILVYLYCSIITGKQLEKEFYKLNSKKLRNSPLYMYIKFETERRLEKERNDRPFISIVVPTRNSANTLEFTLKTCIEQEYDNYEIIVSDNSSKEDNATYDLIKRLDCPRIKYYRTNGELEMHENFEFAYTKVSGEYVMFLGSDDGMLLHGLKMLGDLIVNKNRPQSITWDMVAYGWNDCKPKYMNNRLFIPGLVEPNNIQTYYYDKNALLAILEAKARYSILPMLYCNSIISRTLIEKAKDKFGKVFLYSPPDVYTGIVFTLLQERYLRINVPMTIGGTSGNSIVERTNTKNTFNDAMKKICNSLNTNLPNYIVWFEPEFGPFIYNMEWLKGKVDGIDELIRNNMKNYFESCAKYLYRDEGLKEKKEDMCQCIINYGDTEIIKWFEKEYMNNNQFIGYPHPDEYKVDSGYKNNGLILDCGKFNCYNIFDAAQLYRKILGY